MCHGASPSNTAHLIYPPQERKKLQMWLFTDHGFFSIVQHKDNPAYLLVRARVKGDIERYFPAADVQRTDDADYLYRATIPRAQVMDVVMDVVRNINYTSFKGALKDKSRYDYHAQASSAMREMQGDFMLTEYEEKEIT